MTQPKYIIIAPVKNEEQYVDETVRSIASQSILPTMCVFVDDGSTDKTPGLLDAAAAEHKWIQVVHRTHSGPRRAGGGVMEAFYAGFALLEGHDWDYLVKLDGDVTFEKDYFERCFQEFRTDSKLGIGGGLICNIVNGELKAEAQGDPIFHVRGATKIYRRLCWEVMGGLIKSTGWDTVDEIKANMLGWSTRTFPDIKIVHHRPAGAAYGVWSNWVKNGYANYVTGYHPLFMLVKCLKRFFAPPYGVAAIGLAAGFFKGYLRRLPRVEDTAVITYLRHEQMKRLMLKNSLWG